MNDKIVTVKGLPCCGCGRVPEVLLEKRGLQHAFDRMDEETRDWKYVFNQPYCPECSKMKGSDFFRCKSCGVEMKSIHHWVEIDYGNGAEVERMTICDDCFQNLFDSVMRKLNEKGGAIWHEGMDC